MYESVDVSAWEVYQDETSGVDEKVWLREPASRNLWLFKSTMPDPGGARGEDWAEKAVAQLASGLGVPCAHVEMAERNGRFGVISADLRPNSHEMQPGSVFMQVRGVPGYMPGNIPGRPGHSLENIRDVLAGGLPPPGLELPFNASAFDVFAGYTMLDAWVANRDRHDENWSVLLPITDAGPLRLCGTYDQANSLGYNVPEETRQRLLSEDRVSSWCAKGTAWRFEYVVGKPIPTLVATALRALELASPSARDHWMSRLEQADQGDLQRALAQTPRMSDLARTFALTVLNVNRRRILDADA